MRLGRSVSPWWVLYRLHSACPTRLKLHDGHPHFVKEECSCALKNAVSFRPRKMIRSSQMQIGGRTCAAWNLLRDRRITVEPTSSAIGLAVIVALYIAIGTMSAAGSVYISKSILSAR